ncbi:hypothetical protein [Algiphilus aromaticivorans]|uniref:hypothetical protein n=1 Tax=Algiphilus aromaticivorans TaxID=382454 RepID=UPI0005C1B126|nr:hypothetical protein [Algiphilus aromaticivorans]
MRTTIQPYIEEPVELTAGELQAEEGRPLTVHVHGWDATAFGGKGGLFVELRYAGAYSGPYKRMVPSRAEADELASEWRASLGNGDQCECATCRKTNPH